MKKIYLLLLFVSWFGFGQVNLKGEAYYLLNSTYSLGNAVDDNCGLGGFSELYVSKQKSGNYYLKIDDGVDWQNTSGSWSYSASIPFLKFTESDPIISFHTHSTHRGRPCRGCGCKVLDDRTADLLIQRNETKSYVNMVENGGALAFDGTITMETHPVINLTNLVSANNIIGTDSSIHIPEIYDVLPEYFNWTYHIEGEQERIRVGLSWRWVDLWRSLPSEYQGINSLNIKCDTFLPVEAVGKKITLRANVNGSTVDLFYAKSAPQIDLVDVQPTKCYDTNDGRVKIKFNSKLVDGETLSCSILSYDEKTGQEQGVYYSTPAGQSIVIGDNLTYEIPLDFSKGKYTITLLGFYEKDGYKANTYIMDPKHKSDFYVTSPSPLDFTLQTTNIQCNGGQDGSITITPTGGTRNVLGNDYYSLDNGANWMPFPNDRPYTIQNLPLGTYSIKVKDMNGCIAMESGEEKIIETTITQPLSPLALTYTFKKAPTFYGAENGILVASVSGGTIKDNQSYDFIWKNSKGDTLTAKTQYNSADETYNIILENVPAGEYKLTVTDKNYNTANNKSGCSVMESSEVLIQPDPIVILLEEIQSISCNTENLETNADKFSDGILKATVSGGVPFTGFTNNGFPYKYIWSKFNTDTNLWEELTDYKTDVAENLSKGNYSLNVIDANGIVQGTYNTIGLVTAIPTSKEMVEPVKLELSLDSGNVSCETGSDGWAEARVSGGTPPYVFEWTNGETTAKIENIITNNYFILVTDAKGCLIQDSIFVGAPKGIFTTETVKNPTCYNGNDGSVELNVDGGNLPYTYAWNTGATTKDLNNLVAGNYEVIISSPDCCVYKKKFNLKDPNPIVVDLGKDRTLCDDQVLELDASIVDENAKYYWTSTNGFTSNQPKVSLTKAGTYYVKATSALGCVGEDDIVIKTSEAVIDSEFLLSTQAYMDEEVILVNVSDPFGESTQWIIPKEVNIVEQKEKYITLKFDRIGIYTIGLEQTQGECYATYNKNITVEKRSTLPNAASGSKFIIDFMVAPNPSDGNFTALVNLENNNAINLRLFSTRGELITQKKDSGKKKYEVDFSTTLIGGTYFLVLETEQQTLVKKIIIN